MPQYVWILGGIIAVLLCLFTWGIVRLRRASLDGQQLCRRVSLEQLDELLKECSAAFVAKLGKEISLEQPLELAKVFDEALQSKAMKLDPKVFFARTDHPGWFVLPMGAFLGESLRRHLAQRNVKIRWVEAQDGGLALEMAAPNDASVTLHPFDKILKHSVVGKRGELVAYVETALFSFCPDE